MASTCGMCYGQSGTGAESVVRGAQRRGLGAHQGVCEERDGRVALDGREVEDDHPSTEREARHQRVEPVDQITRCVERERARGDRSMAEGEWVVC